MKWGFPVAPFTDEPAVARVTFLPDGANPQWSMALGSATVGVLLNATPLEIVQVPPEPMVVLFIFLPVNSVKAVGVLRPFCTVKEKSLMAWPFAIVLVVSVLVTGLSRPPETAVNEIVPESEPAIAVNVTSFAWTLGAIVAANSKAMIQADFRIL